MARLEIDTSEFERLQNAIKNFPDDAEKVINDVLHNEGGTLIQDAIRRLIPVSGKEWRGKRTAAKKAKSLMNETGNLFVTVKTTKNYQYLYFPDDGTNTRNHAGEQYFFKRGGESQTTEIIDRCVGRLVSEIENKM